jgi:hypothetical protein
MNSNNNYNYKIMNWTIKFKLLKTNMSNKFNKLNLIIHITFKIIKTKLKLKMKLTNKQSIF